MAESVKPPHKTGYAVNYATYMNHGCRCEGCTEDHRLKHKQWRAQASGDLRARMNARRTERARKQNAAMPTPNTGKPYSDHDKAIALNPMLTARQAAERLGRSMYSIKEYRKQHRKQNSGG